MFFCTCVGVVFVCSLCLGACVCVSVCVSEKESDSEVCVRGAEAVSGLVGVRYFVDNKYLQAQRPTEVRKPRRRGEVSYLRRQSCTLRKHRMGKNMWKPYGNLFLFFFKCVSFGLSGGVTLSPLFKHIWKTIGLYARSCSSEDESQ